MLATLNNQLPGATTQANRLSLQSARPHHTYLTRDTSSCVIPGRRVSALESLHDCGPPDLRRRRNEDALALSAVLCGFRHAVGLLAGAPDRVVAGLHFHVCVRAGNRGESQWRVDGLAGVRAVGSLDAASERAGLVGRADVAPAHNAVRRSGHPLDTEQPRSPESFSPPVLLRSPPIDLLCGGSCPCTRSSS